MQEVEELRQQLEGLRCALMGQACTDPLWASALGRLNRAMAQLVRAEIAVNELSARYRRMMEVEHGNQGKAIQE